MALGARCSNREALTVPLNMQPRARLTGVVAPPPRKEAHLARALGGGDRQVGPWLHIVPASLCGYYRLPLRLQRCQFKVRLGALAEVRGDIQSELGRIGAGQSRWASRGLLQQHWPPYCLQVLSSVSASLPLPRGRQNGDLVTPGEFSSRGPGCPT